MKLIYIIGALAFFGVAQAQEKEPRRLVITGDYCPNLEGAKGPDRGFSFNKKVLSFWKKFFSVKNKDDHHDHDDNHHDHICPVTPP